MNHPERDYVLGTHDDEIERLGLQHAVWRPRATDAWHRAGFTRGQTILDVGCGPGFATFDLAEKVGPEGRIIAFERSQRFLDALHARAAQRSLGNIESRLIDLEEGPFSVGDADGAWCRWVLCFLKDPRAVLEKIVRCLRPSATLVIHEYFDYSTWRFAPPVPHTEEFVEAVMRSWRRTGGEPDIALLIPQWLEELGLKVVALQPIVDVVSPDNFIWQWPTTFAEVGIARLVELNEINEAQAERFRSVFRTAAASPGTRMITPGLLEITARKSTQD